MSNKTNETIIREFMAMQAQQFQQFMAVLGNTSESPTVSVKTVKTAPKRTASKATVPQTVTAPKRTASKGTAKKFQSTVASDGSFTALVGKSDNRIRIPETVFDLVDYNSIRIEGKRVSLGNGADRRPKFTVPSDIASGGDTVHVTRDKGHANSFSITAVTPESGTKAKASGLTVSVKTAPKRTASKATVPQKTVRVISKSAKPEPKVVPVEKKKADKRITSKDERFIPLFEEYLKSPELGKAFQAFVPEIDATLETSSRSEKYLNQRDARHYLSHSSAKAFNSAICKVAWNKFSLWMTLSEMAQVATALMATEYEFEF